MQGGNRARWDETKGRGQGRKLMKGERDGGQDGGTGGTGG